MDAQDFLDSNDPELNTMAAELERVSEASKSESRWDKEFADGSVLVGRSMQGAETVWEVVSPAGLIVP